MNNYKRAYVFPIYCSFKILFHYYLDICHYQQIIQKAPKPSPKIVKTRYYCNPHINLVCNGPTSLAQAEAEREIQCIQASLELLRLYVSTLPTTLPLLLQDEVFLFPQKRIKKSLKKGRKTLDQPNKPKG